MAQRSPAPVSMLLLPSVPNRNKCLALAHPPHICSIKLVIAGNHDLTFDTEHYAKTWTQWHDKKEDDEMIKRLYRQANEYGVFYLEDEMYTLPPEYGGFKCWGAPWQPEFYSWGFNLERGPKLAGMIYRYHINYYFS